MIEPSYPGSAPDGTDLEYTPRPEWRDLRTTDDLLADHERRIRHLEQELLRLLAAALPLAISTTNTGYSSDAAEAIIGHATNSGAFLVAANPPFTPECTR